MRILVDTNYPTHIRLFRNTIEVWKSQGDDARVVARDKDISCSLWDRYRIDYQFAVPVQQNPLFYPVAVLEMDLKIYQLAKDLNPHFLIGTSFAIARVVKLIRGKLIVVSENDYKSSQFFWMLLKQFTDAVLAPVDPQAIAIELRKSVSEWKRSQLGAGNSFRNRTRQYAAPEHN